MKKLLVNLLASVAVCAVATSARADTLYRYSAIDLGTMGWPDSVATALNNNGDVTGYLAGISGQGNHAYLYVSGGQMRDLGTLAGAGDNPYYYGCGINSSRQVVGYSDDSVVGTRAFIYSGDGPMQSVGGTGIVDGAAYAINDAGQVVGTYRTSINGPAHAFIYEDGNTNDLGTFGGNESGASAINDKGQVVGSADLSTPGTVHAFVYSGNGSLQDIGALLGPQGSYDFNGATAISKNGDVLGSYLDDNGDSRTFVWSGTTGMQKVGIPPNLDVCDMNDLGQIVGMGRDSNLREFAFLYEPSGTMQELDNLIDPSTGLDITSAYAINDRGQITGAGIDASGQSHAVLLTPTPEPSTLSLISVTAGAILLCAAARRRWGRSMCDLAFVRADGQHRGQHRQGLNVRRLAERGSLRQFVRDASTIRIGGSSMKKLLFGLLALVALCGTAESAIADTVYPYTVTDLGTMGGQGSDARALNDNGDVVGYAYGVPTGSSGAHAFVYTAASGMRDLGTLPGLTSNVDYLPTAINSSGQVVGSAEDAAGGNYTFLYTTIGGMQEINSPGGLPAGASRIDDAGQIAGSAQISTGGPYHASIFIGAEMTDLKTLGGPNSAATCINNGGQVAGVADLPIAGVSHAFFYSGQGAIQDIGALLGEGNYDYSRADAINDRDQVLGEFIDAGGDWHSFIWSTANGITVPALPPNVLGDAMNNLGQVVGSGLGADGQPFAFIYDETAGMQNLNGLVDLPAGWRITGAWGVNDRSQIACTETDSNGELRAVLLTPTPEPSSLALAACALSLLMIWGACRQCRFLWATRQACVHLQRHIRGQRPRLLERRPLFRRTYDQNWRLFHEEVACQFTGFGGRVRRGYERPRGYPVPLQRHRSRDDGLARQRRDGIEQQWRRRGIPLWRSAGRRSRLPLHERGADARSGHVTGSDWRP